MPFSVLNNHTVASVYSVFLPISLVSCTVNVYYYYYTPENNNNSSGYKNVNLTAIRMHLVATDQYYQYT